MVNIELAHEHSDSDTEVMPELRLQKMWFCKVIWQMSVSRRWSLRWMWRVEPQQQRSWSRSSAHVHLWWFYLRLQTLKTRWWIKLMNLWNKSPGPESEFVMTSDTVRFSLVWVRLGFFLSWSGSEGGRQASPEHTHSSYKEVWWLICAAWRRIGARFVTWGVWCVTLIQGFKLKHYGKCKRNPN